MNTNLNQIIALRNSRVQSSANVKSLLAKRLTQARREAAELRQFANLKPGLVADNCNRLAETIESVIRG